MERQRVFDETLRSPPAGFEFGAGLSKIPHARVLPGLVEQAAGFTNIDLFLDISKGTITPKGCSVTAFCNGCSFPNKSLLDFKCTPQVSPCLESLHAFDDAADCGDPTAYIDGFASLKIDLSSPIQGVQILGNQVTLVSLFAYSFQARVPIGAPPTGTMNLTVWGPGGVGSDWLNGAGSLFLGSVLPSSNEVLAPNSFLPNLDLTGLTAFYLEAALHTVEAFPDNQDAYIGPQALRLRVTEVLDVIVQTADGGHVIDGATVNILTSNGAIVATGTTDTFGVATFALAPGNYFAQSVLGSLTQTSSLLSPVSQSLRFIWTVPRPSVTFNQDAGGTFFFDASASTDLAAGTIANDIFSWNFGDGTTQSGVGLVRVSHFFQPGSFTVQLTQTSPDGLSSTLTLPTTFGFPSFGGGRPPLRE